MGRIADEAKQADERTPWTNKVDGTLKQTIRLVCGDFEGIS